MEDILAKYPNLRPFGLEPYMNDPAQLEADGGFVVSRIDLIRRVIKHMVKKVSPHSKKRIYSYGGKHTVEREIGFYIANGEFIMAMLLEGYAMKPDISVITGRPTPNGTFKAAWVIEDPSLADTWRRFPEGRVLLKYQKKYNTWLEMRNSIERELTEIVGEARDPAKSVWDQFKEVVPRW
jgi:hypothetical protein